MELIARQVGYRYGPVEVLSSIDITLRPGTVHALVGPVGSGKSTLLAILAGLLPPTSGTVVVREDDRETRITAPPPGLGIVFQPPGLWDHLTVEQHLRLVLTGSSVVRDERPHRVEQVLEELALASLRRRKPTQLSAGQRQRLSLARAIVGRPCWLLLDEPLAHLDRQARRDVIDLLRRTCEQTSPAVLIAAHPGDEALTLAHTVTTLLDGRAEPLARPLFTPVADNR